MNSSEVRSSLEKLLAGRPAELVLPNDWTQHLLDTPLLEALMVSPQRISANSAFELLNRSNGDSWREGMTTTWHVVGAVPFTSYIIGKLGLLGGPQGHARRMRDLQKALVSNEAFRLSSEPFLLLQPYWNWKSVWSDEFLQGASADENVETARHHLIQFKVHSSE